MTTPPTAPGPRAPGGGAVRPARHDEIERLREIESAAGAVFRSVAMDTIADDSPPPVVLLAGFVDRGHAWTIPDDDDRPIAYLIESLVDQDAHVDQVSVHPDAARQGLGRRLIEDVATRARAAGRAALTLTTYVDVPWNGPYYERLGFRYLAEDELGPGLAAIRRTEIARGLDRWPRAAMSRAL